MALLDETNLAAEAAKRATFRTNHVGTKLNEGELAEAGGPGLDSDESGCAMSRF